MAYNLFLADRLRFILSGKHIAYTEKIMFGRLVFMINNKFCFSIYKDEMEIRISSDSANSLLSTGRYQPLDPSGKSMKHFIKIPSIALDMDEELEHWVNLSLAYNKILTQDLSQ